MSANEPLEPLGGLAARALAAEREHVPHDAARSEKLFSRVLLSVGAGAVGVAAAGTAHAAAGGAAGGAPLAAGAATKLPLAVVTAKTAAGLAALAFVVGAGTGAVFERSRRPEPIAPQPTVSASPSPSAPPVLTVAPSAPEPLPSATTAPSLPLVATARGTTSVAPPVATEAPAATQDARDADLAAERALVDRARSALARGDTGASLEAVAAHEARFPRGRLTEERELVAIQALVRRGESGAAKARADRFRKAHPKSVFVPAVDRLAPP
ncbi:MAG: hypothetical protein U0183_11365 [Polyangiaceae bacterium]